MVNIAIRTHNLLETLTFNYYTVSSKLLHIDEKKKKKKIANTLTIVP